MVKKSMLIIFIILLVISLVCVSAQAPPPPGGPAPGTGPSSGPKPSAPDPKSSPATYNPTPTLPSTPPSQVAQSSSSQPISSPSQIQSTQSSSQASSQQKTSSPKAPAACSESWTCTFWSDCANGQKKRTCSDASKCGTTINKPDETAVCEISKPKSTNISAKNEANSNQDETNSQVNQEIFRNEPLKKEPFFDFSRQKNLFVIILIAVIGAFVIVIIIIFRRRANKYTSPFLETFGYSEAAFNKIVDYMKRNLELGYDKEIIMQKFISIGHNPDRIKKIMDYTIKNR